MASLQKYESNANYASDNFSPLKQASQSQLGLSQSQGPMLISSRKEVQELKRQQILNKALPLQWVERNLHFRIASDGFYSDFLMYIPFLALFMVFFLNGRDIEINHMAAASNREIYMYSEFPNVAETKAALDAQGTTDSPTLLRDRFFEEIESHADFQRWFGSVLIPGTWDCAQPGYSRATLVKRGQMQYIGAMKVRAILAKNTSCGVNRDYTGGDFFDNFNTTESGNRDDALPSYCYDKFQRDEMQIRQRCDRANPALPQEQLWRFYHDHEDGDELTTTGQMNIYPSGGYVATVPFNATCNEVQEFHRVIQSTAECNIFNTREVRFIMFEWFQYAANTDTYMMNKYFLEVTQGGGWITNFQVRMFPVWTEKRLGMSIFDIFFFIFVLYFVYRLFYDWVQFYRNHKKVLAFCFDLWNLLEVINIVTLVTVCILRWTWWTRSRNSKISFPFDNTEYPQDLDALVLIFSAQIYANSFNVVITILKVLKYFQLNNRLNILTRTLSVSQQGIIGVLALFLFVVTGYAICGVQLYGGFIFDFKNVNTSFSSLSFLLLGQFDYPAMRALQPELTGFFFFSFVILCNFLLLNFIIAILSDGFASVSKDTALEPLDESLLHQLYMLQAYFTFSNLRKVLELRKKGKTRIGLIREMHKYLSEHLDLIEKHSPSMLDNDIPMTRGDLKHWLPEQLYSDLSEPYIDLLWEDMVRDHGTDAASSNYQLHKDIEEAVMKGVALVVKKEKTIVPLAHLSATVDDLEQKIEHVVSLDPAGTTMYGRRGSSMQASGAFARGPSIRRRSSVRK